MAAAPVFPPECASCKAPIAGYLSAHVCGECGMPQPLVAGQDCFAALGVSKAFRQDHALLEKRFYEVSRALHPDRFTTSPPEIKMRSLERMSFLNRAYKTLKSQDTLRAYLLELEGIVAPKAQLPATLAEGWFEIQDLLTEDPERARAALSGFEDRLEAVRLDGVREIEETERSLDQMGFSREGLEKLARDLQTANYIASLKRDIERIKGRVK